MIDLNNESYWTSIKFEVLNHIPVIHSGVSYCDWFYYLCKLKDAGYSKEEAGIWCNEPYEPQNSTWNGIKVKEDNDLGIARGFLVKIARKHGYKLPAQNKQEALLFAAQKWLKDNSENDDFILNYMDKLNQFKKENNYTGDNESIIETIGNEFLINQYLNTKKSDEDKLEEIKNKIFFTKKDKDGNDEEIFNGSALSDLINYLGFRQAVNQDGDIDYLRITNKYFIEKITAKTIKSLIHDECKKIFNEKQYNKIKNSGIIEKERTINAIDIITPAVHDDNNESTFFYFNNCVVEVQKDKHVIHDYNIINGFLWKNAFNSINHVFEYDEEVGDFEKFCKNVVSGDPERFSVLQSIIGYYLSRFRRASLCKCVVLTDRIEEDDLSRGGTGKSTIVEALKEVRSVGQLNGKDKNNDQRFIFSGYRDGNTIYSIDDILENFDTESMFGAITGKTIIERKYENKKDVYLKHIITSNYVPRNIVADESHKRRFNVFELDHYYTSTFTPMDEFGKEFFGEEWTEKDWNQFYSFLIRCEKTFLSNGLKSFETENSDLIKIKKSVNNVVLEFIEDILINNYALTGEKIYVKDLKDKYEYYVKEKNKKYATAGNKLTAELSKFFGDAYERGKDHDGHFIKINKSESPFFQTEKQETKTVEVKEKTVEEDLTNDPFFADAPEVVNEKQIVKVPADIHVGANAGGTYSIYYNGHLYCVDKNGKSLKNNIEIQYV